MENNGTKEILEAISTLSQHVDDTAEDTKKELRGEIGKLRSELIDHVSRTVANATFTTHDPRISKVVLKLRDKNIFNVQDVQDILAQPIAIE
ncbi:hypothetical protein HY477_01095 [Candidatus Uhrbacteria bacterium]|nr:hypothetical protein [Candidatus Uhrbacteria bacterium]